MSLMHKKGFTLLELVVAIGIFAFAMSGILLLFLNSAALDKTNRYKSIATSHAGFVIEDIMEYMRLNELSSLQSQIDSGAWNWNTNAICNELVCTSCAYPCVLNSESIITSCTPGAYNLDTTVRVNWGEDSYLELRTLISKR